MSVSTCIDAMYMFCSAIIVVFGKGLSERAKRRRHCQPLVHQRKEGVSWDAGQHIVHALLVEELSF
jgi:hypothetical protein